MAYTPPSGNAANFTALGYYPGLPIGARISGAYTPPAGNAISFVLGFVSPACTTVNFSVPANNGIDGAGAVTVEITADGHGEHEPINIDGTGSVTIDITAEGHGAHGVAGYGAVVIPISDEGQGAHGVAGPGAAEISIIASGVGVVERYELRGEVRSQGILVNRTVRAYRRDTGELVGQADTIGGKFAIHSGFVEREHYIVPIDPANDATDWAPPCANRVVSVLAQDSV